MAAPLYPDTIDRPFAVNGDKSVIPPTNEESTGNASLNLGFPPITQLPIKAGGIAPKRNDFNGIFNTLSQMQYYWQSGGRIIYLDTLDYPVNAKVYSNNVEFICLQENGPGTEAGVQNPVTATDYWAIVPTYSPFNGYVTEFRSFYEEDVPTGWKQRNGALISNAQTKVPLLYAALQLSENAWKLKTEAEWQAMQAEFGGVGGVPFFVIDTVANTIRLPDTRMMYGRGGSEAVGTVLKAGVPNIEAVVNGVFSVDGYSSTGAIQITEGTGNMTIQGSLPNLGYKLDASLSSEVFGNSTTVTPNTFVWLDCVYTG